MSIYDFTARSIKGRDIAISDYQGKVLLIVNTASKCGFTPQFKGLQELYEKYREKGFEILGFPCNQFAGQDPGTSEEIASFCEINYGVTFTMFDKIKVNGKEAHPLFVYLKEQAPGFAGTKAIKWNFTKFLIGRDGAVIKRFASKDTPQDIEKEIATLL